MCTSLCIGKSMMMFFQIKSAGSGYSMQLMVLQGSPEMFSGSRKGVMKFIIRIVHLIYAEYFLKTPLIKPGVVGYQWKPLN